MTVCVFLLCFVANVVLAAQASLSDDPNFREQVRRAVSAQALLGGRGGNWSDSVVQCRDQEMCDMVDGICEHNDTELVNTLCPIKCGACVCEDSLSTGGNCSSLVPDVCIGVLAEALCAKSCHVCGAPEPEMTTSKPCEDNVAGLVCAELPNPCEESIGQIVCARHCGFCGGSPSTTPQSTAPSCPSPVSSINRIGCSPAEIIFMIEYSWIDSAYDVYWEGSFIRELVDEWRIAEDFIRVGVFVYHDTVEEAIHLGDYINKDALKSKVLQVTSGLRPSGNSNLAAALRYVEENAFTDARPGVEKVVVPIIHQMPAASQAEIPAAATVLKQDCVTLMAHHPWNDRLPASHLSPSKRV